MPLQEPDRLGGQRPARNGRDNAFEKLYLPLRRQEGRMYSDETLALLPDIDKRHLHFNEWQLRKNSWRKLAKHFIAKRRPLRILEIGCGNGWLAHRLSHIQGSEVLGLDINDTELEQAKRVFGAIPNLSFACGDLRDHGMQQERFDIIVFAASIQYFNRLYEILEIALHRLLPNGEIHIIDTHFYTADAVPNARARTKAYYEAAGFPAMADHYFVHSMLELAYFSYTLLHDPGSFCSRLTGDSHPFPWIRIKQDT